MTYPRSAIVLPRSELEHSLTDVRAEMYLVEAERLRVTRLLASPEVQDNLPELERLSQRRRLIESRLEELEAQTAGLRTRLEQADAAVRAQPDTRASSGTDVGRGPDPTR